MEKFRARIFKAPQMTAVVVAAIFIVGLVLRLILIQHGGQFWDPDEDRYLTSRDAAKLVATGELRQGISAVLRGGDHVGYKLLGLIPGVVEYAFGADPRIPAVFFGGFTLVTMLFVWLAARRLAGNGMEALWPLILAFGSATIFYSSRHVAPFDAAIAIQTAALYVGLAKSRSPLRSFAVGFIAALGFVVYYGTWALLGTVVLLHGLVARETLLKRCVVLLRCGMGVALGLSVPVILGVIVGTPVVGGANALSHSIVIGDFRGWIVPWEFLFHADGLLGLVLIALALLALVRGWRVRGWRDWRSNAPLLCATGVIVIWMSFVLTADVLHKFVVHARVARQIMPVLYLAAGLQLASFPRLRLNTYAGQVIAVLTCAHMFFTFAEPLRQEFPRDFFRRGLALLQSRHLQDSADSYYRFVNVEKFVFEPEVLKVAPLETLLEARHPFEYEPYLFEGDTPESRHRRRTIDHRMRLVRMPVLPDEKVNGSGDGPVEMTVTFDPHGSVQPEPLLSIGSFGSGDLFFVRYGVDGRAIFGFERTGTTVILSKSLPIPSGVPMQVRLFSGSLLPPLESPGGAQLIAAKLLYQDRVMVQVNGVSVLEAHVPVTKFDSRLVHAAINRIDRGVAENQFGGRIQHVLRGDLSDIVEQKSWRQADGPAEIVADLSHGNWETPQPICCFGRPEAGATIYLRTENGTPIVGLTGTSLAPGEVHLSAVGSLLRVVISAPQFYPGLGESRWGEIPESIRHWLRNRLVVKVNDQFVFCRRAEDAIPDAANLYLGENLFGAAGVSRSAANGVAFGPKYTVNDGRLCAPEILGRGAGTLFVKVRLPVVFPTSPEPLVVTGATGAGDLLYVSYIGTNHIRLGIDHWGTGTTESELIPVDPGSEHIVGYEIDWTRAAAAENVAARVPGKASEIVKWAEGQGWKRTQTANGPIKYVDESGVVRATIKQGSSRAPGSGSPHVELRDAAGRRVDPAGNPVTRKSPENHTPIEWDLD